ncbi:MAG: hypothetical protein ACTHJ3_02870 [Pararhizobium sp.]
MLGLAAGCTTSGGGSLFGGSRKPQAASAQPQTAPDSTAYVRGTCPTVELRQGTAYYRTYAGGGAKDKDPSKVVHQASLTDTTRKCTVNGNQLTMEVAAAGRVVAGPAGGGGNSVTMPIRVAVISNDGTTVYSQLTKDTVNLDANGSTQFVFTKPDVTFPVSQAGSVRVFVGFDEGPYNTP